MWPRNLSEPRTITTPADHPLTSGNVANNHWELQKATGNNSNTTVLYKDGNGNTPSETVWEIVNGVNPKPIVHDLDNIGEFIRIHRTSIPE
jgi:hypothetical protein